MPVPLSRVLSGRRFDPRKKRRGLAELMTVGQTAPLRIRETKARIISAQLHFPIKLVEHAMRRLGQYGRNQDRDDAQGLGEVVENGVESFALFGVFSKCPRLMTLNEGVTF